MIENQVQAQQPEKKPNPQLVWWLAGGGCVLLLCAAVFVGALLLLGPRFAQVLSPSEAVAPESGSHPQANGNSMGDPNAPVRIIEYGDFQCPYCMRFWRETEPQIIDNYVSSGQVYFEYRSLAFLGQESLDAAEAAYCAGDQGKFWEYHDTLFSNQTGENVGDFSAARLRQFAAQIGLDEAAFAGCLADGTHQATVQAEIDAAHAAGISSTPSFLINGNLVEGAQPYDVFEAEIEAALQGQ